MKRLAICAALLLWLHLCGFAAPVAEQDIPADGGGVTVSAQGTAKKNSRIVMVAVPTRMSFAIDPSAAEDYVYSSSAHEIRNLSDQAVVISLLGIKAEDGTAAKVVPPDTFADWDGLNAEDTMSHIALGVRFSLDTLWSPAEEGNSLDTPCGSYRLEANTMDGMSVDAKFGRAWTEDTALNYVVYLRLALAE